MKPFDKLKTNKSFPGSVRMTEGVYMELQNDALAVFIQKPGLDKEIVSAFEKGFGWYSYLETDALVPVAYWIFKFPDPLGAIECHFNARAAEPDYIKNYLDTTDGFKNGVHFILLNGQILCAKKLIGLSPDAIELFHSTIKKQMDRNYSRTHFDSYLIGLFQFDALELYEM
ncbi:MAG: hypothetical protein V2I56_09125 [Desulfobacteraceae bacterium]|nr:hypothetical protein [Desulfobacteraceae bacterium]